MSHVPPETDISSANRSLRTGSQFAISCGTVTMDLTRRWILLLHYKPKDEYFLPKGRKNVGERMEETCLRETLEEAGVRATLVDHRGDTQATQCRTQPAGLMQSMHSEPIAVTERRGEDNGVWKIIFWFVAQADSSVEPEGRDEQDSRDFEAAWIPVDQIAYWITYRDELHIVRKAIEVVYGLDCVAAVIT